MALPTTALTNGQLPTNPFPLGKVAVAAAGTAVQLCSNFTDLANRSTHYMHIRALDANTGEIYVLAEAGSPPWTLPGGGTTSGADTTNYLNVVQVLQGGEGWDVPSWMMNLLLIGQFWIDAAVNGEGAIAAIGEA